MEDESSSLLSMVLKDHKRQEPIRLMMLNRTRLIRDAASREGYEIAHVAIKDNCKPVHIIFTDKLDTDVRSKLLDGLKIIRHKGVEFRLILEGNDLEGK